ncbi:MAG: sialidase family protein, partial [Ignavibacteria bacterium]|nr:sialidase family protein [Ignavibacteria bacterium]
MNHYYNSFLRNTYTLSILIFILIVNCSVVFSQDFTNVRVNHITTGEQVIWGGNSLSVSGNRIYVLWQDRGNDFSYVSKSTDGGTTFNNGVKIGGSDPQIAGSITTDNSGSVYAAWTGEGWNGIYFAKSTNEAATFSAPLTVSLTGAFPQ